MEVSLLNNHVLIRFPTSWLFFNFDPASNWAERATFFTSFFSFPESSKWKIWAVTFGNFHMVGFFV